MVTRFFLPLIVVWLYSWLAAPSAHALSNQLKNHPSPYLAMHAADPVAWQDWGQAAVNMARREGKLLYISVGYFSCHWCHVMQRESYRDREIAQFLNRHFIPVKVDRELEPALDARLIEFVESTRGMGGWPLNVFITPEGRPLYGILYAPPQEFHTVLKKLHVLWTQERDELLRLARTATVTTEGPGRAHIDARQTRDYVSRLVSGALANSDAVHGGFGEESKFPLAPQLEFLVARVKEQPNAKLKELVQLTLDQMARNGLQDHLGGGFFRYTVDPGWKTPHFEKMLYDNALLARLYLRASRVLARGEYEAVAVRTLDFMARELRDSSGGGFVAALSAVDDKNIEGGYYLWDEDQLKAALTADEFTTYRLAWGMTDAAPFEDGYLPIMALSPAEIARRQKRGPDKVEAVLQAASTKLMRARDKRRVPRDTKVLAGWNGLALAAFAEAAHTLGNKNYREIAKGARDYLVRTLWDGKALRRAVVGGRAVGAVALEDYAYVSLGLLEWARLTGKESDYIQAKQVAAAAWKRFYGPRGWRLSETSLIEAENGQDVITDGPMPSPSAVLAEVSLRLAEQTQDAALRDRALSALDSGHNQVQRNLFWYASHIGAMAAAIADDTQIRP
jgi:uncharacterized protein